MNKNNFTPFILSGHRKSGTSLFRRLFDNIDEINLYPVDLTVLYSYFPYYSELYKNDKIIPHDSLINFKEQFGSQAMIRKVMKLKL